MASPTRLALTVNTGSSSVKIARWALPESRRLASFRLGNDARPGDAFERSLDREDRATVTLVAHRFVHGGERSAPGILDPALEAEIERAAKLAPLHNPRALEWARAARAFFGDAVPQVAVFDTAFFAALPEVARTYALPRDLVAKHGLRRFGFHGLAHESLLKAWVEKRGAPFGRAISFQLGSGCSVAAIRDGAPVDTSMGLTPLEGLVMATRAGDVDPGLLIYLQREAGLTPQALETLLDERSGLLGISGRGRDMKELLAADDAPSRLAVSVFVHRARKYLGAYLAILGGADAILFGGGIGEGSPEIRARILADMEWCGITCDRAANASARGRAARISAPSSRVEAWVFPVDEEALLVAKALQVGRT